MIENTAATFEEGESPLQAALKGSEQIASPSFLLPSALIASSFRLLFMGDIVGRLFANFHHCRHMRRLRRRFSNAHSHDVRQTPSHQKKEDESWFYRKSEDAFNSVIAFYAEPCSLSCAIAPPHFSSPSPLSSARSSSTSTFPKDFFPVQDTGVILGVSEGPQDVSFISMAQRQQALADIILKDPAVESLSSFIGVDGTNTTLNSGRIQINLKPLAQRKINASDVIRRLQPELAESTASRSFCNRFRI